MKDSFYYKMSINFTKNIIYTGECCFEESGKKMINVSIIRDSQDYLELVGIEGTFDYIDNIYRPNTNLKGYIITEDDYDEIITFKRKNWFRKPEKKISKVLKYKQYFKPLFQTNIIFSGEIPRQIFREKL